MIKEHPIFKNFLVSSDGVVFGAKGGALKPRKDKYGYYNVSISYNGKRKTKLVHRLVCETFHKNPNQYATVNHKDGNKTNNHIDNLEWCTVKQNVQHAVLNGLTKTVLTIDEVKYIYTNPDNLNPKQLSQKLNKNKNTIYGIIYNNKWTMITKDLIQNHIPETIQYHNQKCMAIDPNGKHYIFTNKSKFAKENNLNTGCICNCLRKRRKQHKGWHFIVL